MKLDGKKVLVTGGAVRIGSEICRAFAHRNCRIVIHFNKSEREAVKLLGELGGSESGHSILKCDLNDTDSLNEIFAKSGTVDILVNNASVFKTGLLADSRPDSSLESNFKINFEVPVALSRLFSMQNIRSGAILNILDERIVRTRDGDGLYELSKKALMEATYVLARQLAPAIRVNAVAPGAVLSPKGREDLTLEKHIAEMPLKRAPRPEDVAAACVFLAEQDSITGQIIFVDGGGHLNG